MDCSMYRCYFVYISTYSLGLLVLRCGYLLQLVPSEFWFNNPYMLAAMYYARSKMEISLAALIY